MIWEIQAGDVVINFKRHTVYRYNFENAQHYQDRFSCRYATPNEVERFKELEKTKTVVKIADINIKTKGLSREFYKEKYPKEKSNAKFFGRDEFTVSFEMTQTMLLRFVRIAKANKLPYDFAIILDFIMQHFVNDEIMSDNKTMQKELNDTKNIMKNLVNAYEKMSDYVKKK